VRDRLFIFVYILFIISILALMMIRGQKYSSSLENRTLMKFPHLSLSELFSENYQKEIETAFSDQFVLGETIKINFNKVKVINSFLVRKLIRQFATDDDLIPLGNNVYEIGNSGNLVAAPINNFDELVDKLKKGIKNINESKKENPNVNFYVYKINRHSDLLHIDAINNYFLENLNTEIKYMDSSKIKTVDDYLKYFYKTDHHWNEIGSYEGYKDIVKLLFNSDDFIKIETRKCFENVRFNGSRARKIRDFSHYDEFCVYTFDLPEHITKVNQEDKEYGHASEYNNGIYKLGKGVNHYGAYYGWDEGEVIYTFPDNKDENNLLILSKSFSNSINNLIASHFYHTYVVDLRHYEREIGEEFILTNYINKNDIDMVLFISSINERYDFQVK